VRAQLLQAGSLLGLRAGASSSCVRAGEQARQHAQAVQLKFWSGQAAYTKSAAQVKRGEGSMDQEP